VFVSLVLLYRICNIFRIIGSIFFPHLILIIIYFQRLEEHITKNSPTLGRDAVYKKSVSIQQYEHFWEINYKFKRFKCRNYFHAMPYLCFARISNIEISLCDIEI